VITYLVYRVSSCQSTEGHREISAGSVVAAAEFAHADHIANARHALGHARACDSQDWVIAEKDNGLGALDGARLYVTTRLENGNPRTTHYTRL
jgi:hypothetical protein